MLLRDVPADGVTIDVDGQDLRCRRDGPTTFTVDMGAPRFGWRDIPLREDCDTQAIDLGPDLEHYGLGPPAAVSMGTTSSMRSATR